MTSWTGLNPDQLMRQVEERQQWRQIAHSTANPLRLKTRQDLHLTPQLGMTWLEFYDDLWRQKSRVPELSRSVVCVGLCSAILTQYRLVTGRQTDSGLAR